MTSGPVHVAILGKLNSVMVMGSKEIHAILKRHSITPSRSLGQNFVTDPNTIRKIVHLADINSSDHVLEIGPGLGSLTCELANAAQVVVIEFDRYLIPALRETLEDSDMLGRTEIVEADAMEIHWEDFFSKRDTNWKMISNLPYNIASPLLLDVLDSAHQVKEIIVMVQREVGERFAARTGTPAYGIPSVKAQYWSDVSIVGRIPPQVFFPIPKVESVLLQFKRRAYVEPVDLEILWRLVRTGFGQRRKMLRRSLRGVVHPLEFEIAELDSTMRPQDLTVQNWVSLANACKS
jgi:16S rRNA (adenine1518-N6/adenine1519-N6)-dimethyltransferase